MGNVNPYLIFFNFYDKFAAQFTHSPYFKLVLALIGFFILAFLIASVRKHIFKLSMRGAVFGFLLGIILMIFIDLVIILGMTETRVDKIVSGGNSRQALGEAIVSGVANLGKVLGVSKMAEPQKPKTAQEVISDFLGLPNDEAQKTKSLLCPK